MFVICDLKEGDEVGVDWGYGRETIEKVSRTTKTQILIGEKRFHKHNGHEMGAHGDRWTSIPKIVNPTEKLRHRALRRKLLGKINSTKTNTLSTQTLLKICKLIEEDTREED